MTTNWITCPTCGGAKVRWIPEIRTPYIDHEGKQQELVTPAQECVCSGCSGMGQVPANGW